MPHLLLGNFDRPDQPVQGCTCRQAVFFRSDLWGRTDWKHSLLLLTTPEMLLQPIPYAEIPNQPWNPMLDSVNPVTSSVPKSQPAQPDNP